MRTLLLRADASLQIGFGHVLRCLSIAQAWQDAGGEVVFACAALPADLASRLKAESCRVERITAEIGSHSDAAQTQNLAQNCGARWVISDGYRFDGDFFQALQSDAFSLLVLNDSTDIDLSAARAILNPNASANAEFYARFASQTLILAGADFALLRREFRLQPRREKWISNRVERVLITMGGTDIGDLTPRALHFLQSQDFWGQVVVLCGARQFDRPAFDFDLKMVRAQNEVPRWMGWCDIALGAAGATTWELANCGVPAILSAVAPNQRPLSAWCQENGLAIEIGDADEGWEERLKAAWEGLQAAPARRAMSGRAQGAIDGLGAARVVQRLWPSALELRPVRAEDARLLWEWRNDDLTRAMSLQSERVEWETHLAWLGSKLADPDALLLLALSLDGRIVGQIRFDCQGEVAEIDIAVSPTSRGQGFGKQLLERGLTALWQNRTVAVARAGVKTANLASRRLFERAGFSGRTDRSGDAADKGETLEIFEKNRPALPHDH